MLSLLVLIALPRDGATQAGPPSLRVLDVPFVSQSEALCGGAAAAMVMRYWGERGIDAESFAHLVNARAGGITTTSLVNNLTERGWTATAVAGSDARLADEIERFGRPVLALIEDRPGTFHYVVVVGAPSRGVIFHDPARTPFRVMSRDEFERRWRASNHWMAVVVPGRVSQPSEPRVVPAAVVSTNQSPCDALVSEGVRLAQAGDFAGSERSLTSALACPGGAAYREMAGLRALQKRWSDAASLADAATQADPNDAYAWRLLGTARFLQDDRAGALAAFNQAGQPAVDTVQVTGLRRTSAGVIEDAIDVDDGEVLTPGALQRARRRLNEVPALRSGTIEYAPVSGGRAEVRATVSERRLLPTGMNDLASVGGRAIFNRDIRIPIGAMTGHGERLDLQYRFRPGRPRLSATLAAPAPWGGVWSVHGSWERQPFDTPLVEEAERTSGRVAWSDWLSGRLQVQLRGGADRWQDIGARGALGAMVYAASLDQDRVSAQLDVDTWLGDTRFSAAKAIAKYRSSNLREGLVFVGSAGAGIASDELPIESWFAGDSGNARPGPVPLRAHGLVLDGRFFRTEQMGRGIVHGSGEGQYWFALFPPAAATDKPRTGLAGFTDGMRMGIAVFLDSARVTRRLYPGNRNDVDLGAGLRLGLGGRGSVRVDYGRGLIHEDNKFSFGFEL